MVHQVDAVRKQGSDSFIRICFASGRELGCSGPGLGKASEKRRRARPAVRLTESNIFSSRESEYGREYKHGHCMVGDMSMVGNIDIQI